MFYVALVEESDLGIQMVTECSTIEEAVDKGLSFAIARAKQQFDEKEAKESLTNDFLFSAELGNGKGWAVNIFCVG